MQLKKNLILAVCLSSCTQDKPKEILFKTKDFVIADTTIEANQFLKYDIHSSDYPIYYIGSRSDTIRIGRRYWKGRTQWPSDIKTYSSKNYSNNTLRIFVDTTIKTNSPVEYLSDNRKDTQDSTINYNSFLISIKNISDSTIYLGRTFSLFFINREARDKNGNWIKVDKKLSELSISETGEPTITLKPKEIVISKVRRYKGAFVTDFRLVFGYYNNIAYSNVYRDSIDERTLQSFQ